MVLKRKRLYVNLCLVLYLWATLYNPVFPSSGATDSGYGDVQAELRLSVRGRYCVC